MTNGNFWLALGAIGQLLAAIATLAAVIVSLKIARQASQPRLRFSVTLVESDEDDGEPEIHFDLANVGALPSTIMAVGWEIGWIKKDLRLASLLLPAEQLELPIELEPGNAITFRASLPDFIEEVRIHPRIYFRDYLFGLRMARRIRAVAHTWSGESPRAPVDKAIVALTQGRPIPPNASIHISLPVELKHLQKLWRDGGET